MKRISLVTLFVFSTLLGTQAQTQQVATPGPVWRVRLYKVKPGKMNEFMRDLRQNTIPIYEELKKQGLIVDYKLYTNTTTDSPSDWDVAIEIAHKNWAAP